MVLIYLEKLVETTELIRSHVEVDFVVQDLGHQVGIVTYDDSEHIGFDVFVGMEGGLHVDH